MIGDWILEIRGRPRCRGGGRPEIAATLVFRAEPADEAVCFLGGALVVEGDEAGEELLLPRRGCILLPGNPRHIPSYFRILIWRQNDRHSLPLAQILPAIRLEDGGIEVVVDLFQDAHQALFVDLPVLVGKRLPRPQFLQHVVHPRQRQPGVQGLPLLTVRVELLPQFPYPSLQLPFFQRGEGKWVEAAGLCVNRTILKTGAY